MTTVLPMHTKHYALLPLENSKIYGRYNDDDSIITKGYDEVTEIRH